MTIEEFLKSNDIAYIRHEHPAVYTCKDTEKYTTDNSKLAKNLFLKDKKGNRYFLLILPVNKQADLKKFAALANVNKVTFASNEELKERLNLEPGSVSPFGLINDLNKTVELFIDEKIYMSDRVSFHPNINTASLELSKNMFYKFLELIKHNVNVIEL